MYSVIPERHGNALPFKWKIYECSGVLILLYWVINKKCFMFFTRFTGTLSKLQIYIYVIIMNTSCCISWVIIFRRKFTLATNETIFMDKYVSEIVRTLQMKPNAHATVLWINFAPYVRCTNGGGSRNFFRCWRTKNLCLDIKSDLLLQTSQCATAYSQVVYAHGHTRW